MWLWISESARKTWEENLQKLRRASEDGDVATVRDLLKDGNVDVNGRDELGWTPLHRASLNGHEQVVEELLKANAKPNVANNDRETPLHSASLNGHLQVMKTLLKASAKPNAVDNDGDTPLHNASVNNHLQVVKELLKAKADPNAVNNRGTAPLHNASFNNYLQVVQELLKANADPNAVDKEGATPLYWASLKNQLQAVDELLKANADPNAATNTGVTPLLLSAIENKPQVAELLIQANANIHATDTSGWNPLHKASYKGHPQLVDLLLKAKADPNATNEYQWTPLHWAACGGHVQVVQLLLKAKANPNATTEFGQTPLHAGCQFHSSPVVRVLLAAGADLYAKDTDGREPFHSCIQVHKDEKATVETLLTLQALVSAGATWDARCDEMIAAGKARKVAPALRVCALTWAQELADGIPLTDIPLEVLKRGAASTQAYINNFKTSREIVFRRKICLVGSSCAGKTSLVKSITSEEPQLVHLDERTIGIDHFPLRFLQPCPQRETKAHEVTFWDFAGQDAYQVAHSLFFSPRTMFLVCVDLEAFTVAFLQASMMAHVRKHETQLMDEFIEHTVMRWVRVILARQPDAEFVFIATKEDLLAENEATEQLLKRALMAKLNAVNATVDEMRNKVVKENWDVDNDIAFVSEGHAAVATDSPNVVFTSCKSPVSVKSARLRIEDLIIKSGRGFQMPDTYTKVLEAIVARRESAHTSDITTRITRVFAPLETLPTELGIEPELCRTILQTLHDLGDVLWYEDLGVKMFRNTVILDPLLLIDFIRQVINHNHTGLTMPHADLKSLPYWVGLSSKQQMKALKQVLQKFRLVYSADDDRMMDWDSDLIVPAYWQTKTPAAWLFLGDILRIDETTSRRIRDRASVRVDWEHHLLRVDTAMARDGEAVRIHWEFHFEYGLPSSLFDRVIVASVSPHFVFTAGPDWIVHEEKQIAASRIMVGRDGKSLHRTIHVEAVVAVAATKRQVEKLWRSFTRMCDAFVDVLCEYPGLAVSSFAWDHGGNKVGLRRLAKSAPSSADSEAWMPPAVLWVWFSELVTKSTRRGDQVADYHRFDSSEDTE